MSPELAGMLLIFAGGPLALFSAWLAHRFAPFLDRVTGYTQR